MLFEKTIDLKKKTKGINLQQTYSTKNVKGISQIEGI